MINLSKHRITVHSRHALLEDFDPAVLSGRDIFNARSYGFLSLRDETPLHVEGVEASWRSTSVGNVCVLREYPHRVFDDVYDLTPEGGLVVIKGVMSGRLVTTADGQTVGVLIGGKRQQGGKVSEVTLTPAHTLIDAVPEHIRDALKGKFNAEVLKGKPLGTLSQKMEYFALEGALDKPGYFHTSSPSHHTKVVMIDKRPYKESFEISSYKKGPQSPYNDDPTRLFTSKRDIGRLVYGWQDYKERHDPSKAEVIGVVAGMEQHYNHDHRRIYQKTHCVSAPDLLVP